MWAECTNCRAVFEPQNFVQVSGSATLNLKGNTVNCPKCGGRARVIDGKFSFDKGTLTSVSNLSARDAQIVANILKKAWRSPPRGPSDREKLASEIETAAPGGAKLAEQIREGVPLFSLLISILTLLLMIQSGRQQADHNEEMLAASQKLVEIATRDSSSLERIAGALETQNDQIRDFSLTLSEQIELLQKATQNEPDDEISLHKRLNDKRRARRQRLTKKN